VLAGRFFDSEDSAGHNKSASSPINWPRDSSATRHRRSADHQAERRPSVHGRRVFKESVDTFGQSEFRKIHADSIYGQPLLHADFGGLSDLSIAASPRT